MTLTAAPPTETTAASQTETAAVDDTSIVVGAAKRRVRGRLAFRLLAVVLVAGTASVLFVELRHTDIRATLSHIQWEYACLAAAAFTVSVFAAAYNLIGFAPLRLRLGPTVLAQLAVGAIRVVTPSAMSTPAICARYLVRSGATVPDAVAAVGVAQTVQFLVTVALFTGFGLTSGWTDLLDVGSLRLGLILGAVLLVYLLIWLVIRRSVRAARLAQHARHGLSSVIAHVRARPGVAVCGIVASAVLTAAHIAAFALCVRACGGQASITTLAAVYLAATAAGSVIPTPGGTGAIEATMIAGLTVAGIPLPVATAATVLSRVVTVWTLVPPGWLALISLRRRGLV